MAWFPNTYFNAPEHKEEGSTKRTNFSLNGPLGGDFSFRLNGNLDKTRPMHGTLTTVTSQHVQGHMPIRCLRVVKG